MSKRLTYSAPRQRTLLDSPAELPSLVSQAAQRLGSRSTVGRHP
jgi:hypothetical protein